MISLELMRGVVKSFDAHRGLGYINADDEMYLFHCAEIVDGTRNIAVNTSVDFIAVERFGIREASVVTARATGNS